jgi:hypothetical protein
MGVAIGTTVGYGVRFEDATNQVGAIWHCRGRCYRGGSLSRMLSIILRAVRLYLLNPLYGFIHRTLQGRALVCCAFQTCI